MTGQSRQKFMQRVWLCVLMLGIAGSAQAQDVQCVDALSQANAVYLEGRFDQTVRLLRDCLEGATLAAEEAIPVYRLLALAHLNQGETAEAQVTISDLLMLVPTYEADPIQDPPSYADLVNTQREEMAPPQVTIAEEEENEIEDPLQPPVEEEADTEEPRRVLDPPPPVSQQSEAPPRQMPEPRQETAFFAQPKSWLIAGGGALVIFAALGLAVGGGPSTSGQ